MEPAAAGHRCPACDAPVDALRAGRVALIGARFLYFCDAKCKTAYFADPARASGPVISTEIATAEPPRVAPAPLAVAPLEPVAEPLAEPPSAPELPADVTVPPPPVTLRAPVSEVARAARIAELVAPTSDPPPDVTLEDDAPRSMPLRAWSNRSATETAPMSTTGPGQARAPRSMPALVLAIGVASGLLSLGAALLGSGGVVRLALAAFAIAATTVHAFVVPRDPSDPSRVARLLPLYGSFAIALQSQLTVGGGGAHLVACGVGAAAMLLVERVVVRAKEQLAAKRVRVHDALESTASMADGTHIAGSAVRAGDVFVVADGAVVAADGVVVAGEAVVSPHVDATVDVTKREGDVIVAGARVLAGTLRITASFGGPERAYARALGERGRPDVSAPLVRLALRGAREGGFVVFALVALATFGTGANLPNALGNGFAAMLALGASGVAAAVAVEHARAHLRALSHGVVHRDAVAFERAGNVSRAVVCARGTLLLGEPEILSVEALAGATESEVLALASAIATGWTHPFGVALLHHAKSHGVRAASFRSVIHQGSGATGVDSGGTRLVLGRRPFLLSEKISVAVADAAVTAHEEQGRSVLLLARGDRLVGIVAMQDGLRAGARAAIQRLHDADVEPVLLSGESRETCEMLGRSLDIDNLRPDVARGERAQAVKSLGEGGDVVAVIGTPALDEEALGAADVAVAIGAAGSATEHAVVLASADVRDAVLGLVLPKIARERSRTALALGLSPGVAFALASSFGLLSPAVAPLALLLGASLAILYAKE
jgi:cation transport ATPase